MMFYTKHDLERLNDRFASVNLDYYNLRSKLYDLEDKYNLLLRHLGLYEQKVKAHTLLVSSEKCTTQTTNN